IPGVAPIGRLQLLPAPEARRGRLQLAQALVARDYQEVITYSFVDPAWERDFAANATPVAVINPIAAQMAVMRSTLAGGLVATLGFNLKRRQERVRLFEIGRTFAHAPQGAADAYVQQSRLGVLSYGSALPEQWGEGARRADFFDLKGDFEALVPGLRCRAAAHPALHPGRSAELLLADRVVGWLGELHPALLAPYDLVQAPILAELDLDAALGGQVPRFVEPSRFPPVRRDISVIVDESIAVDDLLDALKKQGPAAVVDIGIFDLYRGKGLPEGKKSLAFRIVIQDTARTLTDIEIDEVTTGMKRMLAERFGAELRK
ncbi:MAG: phenylalanine--tRNA ligase subunit beta, partial [Pseudomonadota bacterium]|nr:phenylalanine--tRNA ligase subunit beta [Pseudomonadota bacterium]